MTITESNSPNTTNLVAGSTAEIASKYKFKALREDFDISKVTIYNDTNLGAMDTPGGTNAIDSITIRYPDVNGVLQEATASLLVGGTATFSGLGFYVPNGEDVYLEVLANIAGISGVESRSGQTFRLGIQDTTNTVNTFNAVGQSSSTTFNNPTISGGGSVNTFVVRKTVPTFANVSGLSGSMGSGVPMIGFTVTADSAGDLGFGRFVFTVDRNTVNTDYGNCRFYENATPLNIASEVLIYSSTAVDLRSGTQPKLAGTTSVVVSFYDEMEVGTGSTKTFKLTCDVNGTTAGDRVTTKLAVGDETAPVTAILLTPSCSDTDNEVCSVGTAADANTGVIYDKDANEGLFVAVEPSSIFTQTVGVARNIIWSDHSADNHGYVTVCTAAATPDAACGADSDVVLTTGTARTQIEYDWTNGFALQSTSLSSHSVEF